VYYCEESIFIWTFGVAARWTQNMNYFAYPTAAERYANGRPFFHPLAVKKIGTICCESGRINRALDVGCGTGQSTLALLELAEEIVGLDNSAEMLSHALRHAQVRYVEARAEQMPFDDKSYGLITVGGHFIGSTAQNSSSKRGE
jgi:SAM-dependent methyltransferase